MNEDKNYILAQYTSPNVGNHHIIGAATGQKYRYAAGGGPPFLVHKDDIAAQPHLFRPIASAVEQPAIEEVSAPLPPQPIAVSMKQEEQSSIMPVGNEGTLEEAIARFEQPADGKPSTETPLPTAEELPIPTAIAPVVPDVVEEVIHPPASEQIVDIPSTQIVETNPTNENIGGISPAGVAKPRVDLPEVSQDPEAPLVNTFVPPTIATGDEMVDLEAIPGINSTVAKELTSRGLTTKNAILEVGVEGLQEINGIGEVRAYGIMTALSLDARQAKT